MYDHKKIEKKWQGKWDKEELYKAEDDSDKPKKYVLDMFPYPSAAGLHVGHPEGYTATDIMSRYWRMNGYNVLHPMGWDAFGLPAENFAIKEGVHPRKKTAENIKTFKRQIKALGLSYDWSREIDTSSPEYYKWTQWIFLQLYQEGLAYKKKAPVNWCESCKTVLANEQVVDGKCERCKNEVIQKELNQWFFKITEYAEKLLNGLDDIDWPEPIKQMQRNWIGKSTGAELVFPIDRKIKYVLLPGFGGSPEGVFLPWAKKELEAMGHEVKILDLPNTDNPSEEEQVEFALEQAEYDENTIVCGHSLGAVVAMKVIEKLPNKIKGLVLVGGFTKPEFKDSPRPFADKFEWEFDFEKIKQKAGNVKVLSSVDDYAVPSEEGKILERELEAELVEEKGSEPHFAGEKEEIVLNNLVDGIKVFTTRPDTIYGATYMVLAPEHELVSELMDQIENKDEVEDYLIEAVKKSELERTDLAKEKTGVVLKGVKAMNPANKKLVPIYIADYVLRSYGTGAIMAVPAHDERDMEFAERYGIDVIRVVDGSEENDDKGNVEKKQSKVGEYGNTSVQKVVFIGSGKMINSEEFDGMDSEIAKKKIVENIGGVWKINYKIKDWLVSRQRYWGAPIPIIYCDKCGEVPVPEDQLPVELPDDVDFQPTGESPLVGSSSFHRVKCPKCGSSEGVKREVDTMDTFVCSSWYYLRYCDPKNDKSFASEDKLMEWMPVDLYVGGAEHAVMHLIYARFFYKALKDMGQVMIDSVEDKDEPFQRLKNQGMILAEDGRKMSKSLGNVINPDEVVEQYGADTMRMYEMFMGPFEDSKPWDTKGIIGIRRFLDKVDRVLSEKDYTITDDRNFLQILNKTIKKVTEDIEGFKFNTAISAMMVCLREFEKSKRVGKDEARLFLQILSPFAPHLAEELWEKLGQKKSIFYERWPKVDEKYLIEETVEVVVQVNGKVRGKVEVEAGISEDLVVEKAREVENVMKYIENRETKKVIYIKDKLLNIVI